MHFTEKNRPFNLPLKAVEIYVKNLLLDDLTEPDRDFVVETFGEFFSPPSESPYQDDPTVPFRSEPRYNIRRFSGGDKLPRSRYSTLCQDANGHSHQTLAMELLAYGTRKANQWIDVYDLNDNFDFVTKYLSREQISLCSRHSDKVLVVRREQIKTVVLERVGVSRKTSFHVIPYGISKVIGQNVFDLRERDSMRQLLTLIWEQLPSGYALPLSGRSVEEIRTLTAGNGPITMIAPYLNEDFHRVSIENGCVANLKQIYGDKNAFIEFLGFLLASFLGGTPVTDYIANLIKRSGAEGLIFPSARHDTYVKYTESGGINSWMGWNYVNYRGISEFYGAETSWVFEDIDYFNRLSGSLEIDPHVIVEPTSYRVESWGLHGVNDITRGQAKLRAWEARLGTEDDASLPRAPLTIERTPWPGYAVGARRRKPRQFETVGEIKMALLTNEVRMNSAVVKPKASVSTVSALLAQVINKRARHEGIRLIAAAHDELWYLLLREDDGTIHLECAACGYRIGIKLAGLLECPLCSLTSDGADRDRAVLGLIGAFEVTLSRLTKR